MIRDALADCSKRTVILPVNINDRIWYLLPTHTFELAPVVGFACNQHAEWSVVAKIISNQTSTGYTDVELPFEHKGISWFTSKEEAESIRKG